MKKIKRTILFTVTVIFCYGLIFNLYAYNGQEANDKYFTANALYNKKMFNLAEEEYKNFLLTYPEHPKVVNAKLGLALSYYEQKKYTKARKLFAELAENRRAPHQEQIHNLLGQCLLIANRPADAEAAFRWSVNRGKEKLYLELPGVAQKHEESPQISTAAIQDLEPLERSLAGLIEALFQQKKWEEVVSNVKELAKIVPDGNFTPRARFLSALAYYEMKKYEDSTKVLRKLVANSKNFPFLEHAIFLLAECQYKLGKYNTAITDLQKISKKGKGKFTSNAMFRLGYIKFLQKNYSSAIKEFKDLLSIYPKSHYANEAGIYLGRCYLGMKNYSKAQAIFGALTNKAEISANATQWLSQTFLRQKKYKSAESILKPALTKYKKDPLLPNLLFDYANALLGQNKFSQAAPYFKKAVSLSKKAILTSDSLRLQAFSENRSKQYAASLKTCDKFLDEFQYSPSSKDVAFLKAENLYFMNKYAKAINEYVQFIPWQGKEKYTNEARMRLAQCFMQLRKWSKAISELRPLIDQNIRGKFFDRLYYLAGIASYNLKRWKETVFYLNKFTKMYPKSEGSDSALIKLAFAYSKREETDKAINTLKEVIKLHPNSKHIDQAYTELGRYQYFNKKLDLAKRNLEKVLKSYKNSKFTAQAEYYLGWILLEQGYKDEAVKHFSIVAEVYPKSPLASDALYQEALILLDQNNFKTSRKRFKEFLNKYSKDPNAANATFYYGICNAKLGNTKDSAGIFKKFIKENPYSSNVPRALYEAAWQDRKLGRTQQAKDSYINLIKKYPLNKLTNKATLELAEIEYEQGDYGKSIQYLDILQAKHIQGELREKVLFRLGWCLLARGQQKLAAENFEKLILEFPKTEYTSIAAYQAGEIYFTEKNFEKALKLFTITVLRQNDSKIHEQALLRLGETQTLTDRWVDALKSFSTFIRQYPASKFLRRAYLWQGWSQENLKRYDSALKSYRFVISKGIKDILAARSQFQIGECYFAQKDYNKAIKELIKVGLNYSFPKWNSKAILEMGLAFERLGQFEKASHEFKKVINEYPGSNEAVVARNMLKERNINKKQ